MTFSKESQISLAPERGNERWPRRSTEVTPPDFFYAIMLDKGLKLIGNGKY